MPETDWSMKGLLAGVVKTVTARPRVRKRRERWRSGIVWPLDKKGNKTTWRLGSSEGLGEFEPIFFLLHSNQFLWFGNNEYIRTKKELSILYMCGLNFEVA